MVVTTLIIILLVLVAIGIVWVVVRNMIQGGVGGIELSTKCLNTNVKATAISCSNGICDVTLTRTGSNNDEIAGVKLVFFNETENSAVIDESGNVETLVKKTITINSTLSDPNKIEVTAYFEGESGSEQHCSQTSTSGIGTGSSGGNGDDGGDGAVCGDGTCNGLEICGDTNNAPECNDDCEACPGGGESYCGDGTCDSGETCGDNNVAPACNIDCNACPSEDCGNGVINGIEECDGGTNCIVDGLLDECTCEVGFIPTDPITVNCQVDPSTVCDGTFEEGEQCDGGTGCILLGEENECTCDSGYIPTDPPSPDCEQITFIDSGTVDLVWPPGAVKYLDSQDLPKDAEIILDYWGMYVKFTSGAEIGECLQITWAEYLDEPAYDKSYLRLIRVAVIVGGEIETYEIWETEELCLG